MMLCVTVNPYVCIAVGIGCVLCSHLQWVWSGGIGRGLVAWVRFSAGGYSGRNISLVRVI